MASPFLLEKIMSSYRGFLLKVGNYEINAHKYIRAESYSVTRLVQDLDSYRDENGVLHRTVVENTPIKVEFETPAMLTDDDMEWFIANLYANKLDERERKYMVTCYVPEINDYRTIPMYMPDPKFEIYTTHSGVIRYKPIRFAFIGY